MSSLYTLGFRTDCARNMFNDLSLYLRTERKTCMGLLTSFFLNLERSTNACKIVVRRFLCLGIIVTVLARDDNSLRIFRNSRIVGDSTLMNAKVES